MLRLFQQLIFCLFIVLFAISCEKAETALATESTATDGLAYASGSKSGVGVSVPGLPGDTTKYASGVITAGEWNDAQNWSFFNNIMKNDTFANTQAKWGFYMNGEWKFIVKDAANNLLGDAEILISNNSGKVWAGKTNIHGELFVIPGIFKKSGYDQLSYNINYKGALVATGTLSSAQKVINVSTSAIKESINTVDLMFIVDATGSMGDELEYLKNELLNVLQRAADTLPGKNFRYSSVFYRDKGDEYITRPLAFSSNRSSIESFVKDQKADNGGDWPEAVDAALETALTQSWSANARARLAFLILDAPPHETTENLSNLREQVKLAAEKGVMLIPVSASGIDKETEFLLRYMALATNGTYTFITNHSGIGGDHIKATVGNYKVEFLNNLIVRLIDKYSR